jgi:Secretion system C-terminal sorting domain
MCKRYFYLFFLINYLFFPAVPTFSQTNWYVDRNAIGSNKGTNWANAWNSFSNINWNSVSAGDTVFISGGTDSTVYNETLTIGQSGISAGRIVITKGLTTGHNGKVVIDGQNSRDYCVDFNSSPFITLSYIKCADAATTEIRIRASNCTVSHCEIYHTEGIMSIDMYGGSNNIIEYVSADESPTPIAGSFDGNGDFMQCSGGGNNIFRFNNITLRDEVVDDHCDALQFYFSNIPDETPISGGKWEIYGNIIRHTDTKIYNAQGIYIEGLDSAVLDNTTWYIYDNLIILPYAFDGIGIRNNNLKAYIYNNTIYQGRDVGSPGFYISNDQFTASRNNIIIKNNIFYSASTGIEPFSITDTLKSGCDISNNLIYSPMSTPINYLNNEISLAAWNAYPFVGTDLAGDPLFNNIAAFNFTIRSGSPAIGKGVNLGSPYNIDLFGNPRSSSGNWDIGCYLSMDTADILNINNTTTSFKLMQNYPNPFNPSTTIQYTIPQDVFVTIKVFDTTGREIKTLVDQFQQRGNYSTNFSAANLSSGVYFYRIIAGNFENTKKMVLLK